MEYAGTFWAISGGGEMWKKKGEVVCLWCDLSTQENTVWVCHGKQIQWKESLLFTSGNSKHFLFVCRHTGKRLATQDCTIERYIRWNLSTLDAETCHTWVIEQLVDNCDTLSEVYSKLTLKVILQLPCPEFSTTLNIMAWLLFLNDHSH